MEKNFWSPGDKFFHSLPLPSFFTKIMSGAGR